MRQEFGESRVSQLEGELWAARQEIGVQKEAHARTCEELATVRRLFFHTQKLLRDPPPEIRRDYDWYDRDYQEFADRILEAAGKIPLR